MAFLLTEDMRLPMILIDDWTPLMLLFLAACRFVDFRLIRYRGRLMVEDDRQLRWKAKKIIAARDAEGTTE